IDVVSGDRVMNAYRREYLRRAFRLVSFHSNFVTGEFLVELLPQNRHHVEGCAAGEGGCNQFDWLRASSAGSIVEQQIVAAAGGCHELSLWLKWLSQFHFGADHAWLLVLEQTGHDE